MACFKILFQFSTKETEENQESLSQQKARSQSRFKLCNPEHKCSAPGLPLQQPAQLMWVVDVKRRTCVLTQCMLYCAGRLYWQPNEGREGRRVGPEGGSFTSVAGNVCSASILRLLADSIACGDTQQWLSPAQGGKQSNSQKVRTGISLILTVYSNDVFVTVTITRARATLMLPGRLCGR